MKLRTHTYTHLTHTPTHTHAWTRTHAHTHTRTHAHTNTQTHAHTNTRTHKHTHTQTHGPSIVVNLFHSTTMLINDPDRCTLEHRHIFTRTYIAVLSKPSAPTTTCVFVITVNTRRSILARVVCASVYSKHNYLVTTVRHFVVYFVV